MSKKDFSRLKRSLIDIPKQNENLLKIENDLVTLKSSLTGKKRHLKDLAKSFEKADETINSSTKKVEKLNDELTTLKKKIKQFEKDNFNGSTKETFFKNKFGPSIEVQEKIIEDTNSFYLKKLTIVVLSVWLILSICSYLFELKDHQGEPAIYMFTVIAFILWICFLGLHDAFIGRIIKNRAIKKISDIHKQFMGHGFSNYEDYLKLRTNLSAKKGRLITKIKKFQNVKKSHPSITNEIIEIKKKIKMLEKQVLEIKSKINSEINWISTIIPYSENLNLELL